MSAREQNTPTASNTPKETEQKMSAKQTTRRIATALVGAIAALAAAAVLAAPAMAAPELGVSMTPVPSSGIAAGGKTQLEVNISNTGDEMLFFSPIKLDFDAPEGVEIVEARDATGKLFEEFLGMPLTLWECSVSEDRHSASCEGIELSGAIGGPFPVFPGEVACTGLLGLACPVNLVLEGDPGLPHEGEVGPISVEVSGGGAAAPVSESESLTTWLSFDLIDFESANYDDEENPFTEAGGRPYTNVTSFDFPASIEDVLHGLEGFTVPNEEVHDGHVLAPPGLVANPIAYPQCTEAQLATATCAADSQIGTVELKAGDGSTALLPFYNMVPPAGDPALFAFTIGLVWVHVRPVIQPDGAFSLDTLGANQLISISGLEFTYWGVPADPAHDEQRRGPGCPFPTGCESAAPLKPYLTAPTSCTGPQTTTMRADSWQNIGVFAEESFVSPGNDGCNALDFSPDIEARPTTTIADAPSGLDVDVHVPQREDCDPGPPLSCEAASAHLRDTVLTLPEGLTINPSGANGLGSCSPAQVGIDAETGTPDASKPSCPNASRIGSVEVEGPLVDHTMPGSVYLATPYDNPFDSLIAIYIVIDDPDSGILQKLSGEVSLDPATGQMTTTMSDAPQLPFEHLKLHLFGGARGVLRTPAVCGNYESTSTLTPWSAPDSGPPATPVDSWSIDQAADGGVCPFSDGARPNSPTLDAGAVSPIAGSYTPVVVDLRRPDGSQELSTLNLTLPPGLTGKLAGVGQCSDAALAAAAAKSGQAEKASPSCPAGSRLGTVDIAAGAGPAPYWTRGAAYLTGPYKGAALGMAIVIPAVAGPFDLGTVVVRTALDLHPETGQLTASTDAIPSVLQGIRLDVRTAIVRLDRAQFTRTGTNCNPFDFTGQMVSTLGQSAALSSRYQLGECGRLAFKPKLGLRLFGATKRGGHPRLRSVVALPEGGANIARASIALPRSVFLDQSNIRTVCTRVQFAADACPKASIYGFARATSPLVDYAISGPVYLRSSNNKLPDLVAALHGPAHQPIEVDVVGRIDSRRGGIRTTFEAVPDLPVSRLVLNMKGGRKGLLQNSRNICRRKYRAKVLFDGQNAKAVDRHPLLRNGRCNKQRRKTKRNNRQARRNALAARRAVR